MTTDIVIAGETRTRVGTCHGAFASTPAHASAAAWVSR